MNKDNKKSLTKKLAYLLPVLALAFSLALNTGAEAKEGSDDPAGHVRNSGTDDNKSDDGASKQRHTGTDDNKVGDGAHQARGTGDDDAAKGRADSTDDNSGVSNASRNQVSQPLASPSNEGNMEADVVEDNQAVDEVANEDAADMPEAALDGANEPAHVDVADVPEEGEPGFLATLANTMKSMVNRVLGRN